MTEQPRMNATEIARNGRLPNYLIAQIEEPMVTCCNLSIATSTRSGVSQIQWTSKEPLQTDGIQRDDYYFAPVGSAKKAAARIASFADSVPPSESGLIWLSNSFLECYSAETPAPSVFPTPRGTIEMEWSANGQTIIVEVSLETRKSDCS